MALLRRHIAELFSTHDEFIDIRSENCYILGSRSRIALSPSLANEGNCILQYKCWLVLCRHRSGTRTTFSHHISICFISYGKTVMELWLYFLVYLESSVAPINGGSAIISGLEQQNISSLRIFYDGKITGLYLTRSDQSTRFEHSSKGLLVLVIWIYITE